MESETFRPEREVLQGLGFLIQKRRLPERLVPQRVPPEFTVSDLLVTWTFRTRIGSPREWSPSVSREKKAAPQDLRFQKA